MINIKNKIKVEKIYKDYNSFDGKEVIVCGWIRNIRNSKVIGFIELNDGSFFKPVQIVLEESLNNFADIISLNLGSSIIVNGVLKVTPDAKQPFEIVAKEI